MDVSVRLPSFGRAVHIMLEENKGEACFYIEELSNFASRRMLMVFAASEDAAVALTDT